MLTRNERQLKAVEQEMERRSRAIQDVWKKAESDERETSPDERGEVEKELKAIEELKVQKSDLEDAIGVEKEVKKIAGEIKPDDGSDDGGVELKSGLQSLQIHRAKSIGEQFVESEGYQKAIERARQAGGIPRGFSTGAVELEGEGFGLEGKGTLLEGAGAPGTGTGGGLLPSPQVVPGVTETRFQRLSVADLIPQATTNTNTVRYVVEGTATSGAAGVAEAAAKPESTLALSTTDEPVKKIATSLTVSDEMLEDAAQTQGYINGRLSLFVRIEDERQLVLGGGTNELVGITGRSGVTTWGRGTVDNNAIALFKAMNGQRGSSFLEPSAIIMNPANWQTTRLLADSAGQFFGGGPFQGPYGSGQNQTAGGVTAFMDSIWGKPVVVTSAIGAGTALVGAFDTAAQIYRRSGVTVEATNSHSDYFVKNLVMVRAEERLALCVYRPHAFTLVTGLN